MLPVTQLLSMASPHLAPKLAHDLLTVSYLNVAIITVSKNLQRNSHHRQRSTGIDGALGRWMGLADYII